MKNTKVLLSDVPSEYQDYDCYNESEWPVRMEYFGWHRCRSAYAWVSPRRDCYSIHYVLRGEGNCVIRGAAHHLRPNEAFLMRPEDGRVAYSTDTANPWHYAFFAFTCPPVFIEDTVFADSASVAKIGCIPLVSRLQDVTARLNRSPRSLFVNNECLLELLRFFERPFGEAEEDAASLYVRQAKEYIRTNFFREISVADIAGELALTRCYFSSVFKRKTGLSPMQYLTEYRLDQAYRMLQESNIPLKAITSTCGYSSYSTFLSILRTPSCSSLE